MTNENDKNGKHTRAKNKHIYQMLAQVIQHAGGTYNKMQLNARTHTGNANTTPYTDPHRIRNMTNSSMRNLQIYMRKAARPIDEKG